MLPTTVVREVGLQKLLATRICDLNLRPEGILAECVEQVIGELQRKGITFVPAYYLGDDDFWTADRAVSVNIPWYLANPMLWQLVNDHLFEYTREEVLMYLRHEAGHAINYAFELWRRKDWTQTFGDFRRPYRDVYNPNPWSRDYVRYLHRAGMYHYAQKHPDEDWAETFAVWLEGGPLAAALPRLAGGAGQARVRRPHRRHRARLPRQPRPTSAWACGSRTRRSRRPSPSTSTSTTTWTRTCWSTAATCWRSSRAGRRAPAPSPRAACSRAPPTPSRRRASSSSTRTSSPTASSAGSATATSARSSQLLRQLQALCTAEHMVVPDSRRTEKLVELTVVATWHVVDGIHRLS